MLLVYMLLGATALSLLLVGYSRIIGRRDSKNIEVEKKSYPDIWLVSLLDCEYSPTKQSYGPARILPVTKVRLMPASRGCENC